ncbi:molybdate ABC transporter substrate-binding protein [Faunimonas pinastri]|nr:molybdate ABC transporter substrate-binding protein [Faunimonas pinastri]
MPGTNQNEIRVLAAGSLRHAMASLGAAFESRTGLAIKARFGPAGVLREQIEAGEAFDLFASANLAHPEKLCERGLSGPVTCFAQNRLCIVARAALGLTPENMLQVMLDPLTRLATSTPGADPSGDYAMAFFQAVERSSPGVGSKLAGKSLHLVGGAGSSLVPAGFSASEWLIGNDQADLFVGYLSGAGSALLNPDLSVLPLPPDLGPEVKYGLCLARQFRPGAEQLRAFLLSAEAQAILAEHGFLPCAGE